MVYLTIVKNETGGDMGRQSGVDGHPFNIPAGGSIVIPSKDEYQPFARYESITFTKGKTRYHERRDSDLITKTSSPGKVKTKIRPDWVEPKRPFPVVAFLNLEGATMEVLYTDIGKKLMLPRGIMILASIPCYSKMAPYREYVIHRDVRVDKQSGFDLFPNHELKGKRSEQELARLAKLIAEWRESERNRIKMM